MVITRTKLMIHDDILKPFPDVTIKFAGVDPLKFAHKVPNILCAVFRVHRGQIQEKKVSITKGDPEKFKFVWEMDKDLDKFTYYYLELEVSGSMSKGVGHAEVVIKPALRTEYPQDTVWEKSLLYEFVRMAWHTFFYNSKREEWIRDGRRLVAQLIEDIKALSHKEQD